MSTSEGRIAKVFGLDDEGWQRHANPWSVYTRMPLTLLFAAAIWTRVWIGWWALIPIGVLGLWTWINPRVFPPPRSLDHWASKSVLGEAVWSKRKENPVPPQHRTVPNILAVVSTLGLPFIVWGLVVLDVWILITGLAIQTAGKLWFLDRMVWLYDDVTRERGEQVRPGPRPTGTAPAAT